DANGNPIPIDSSAYRLITNIQDDSKIEPTGFVLYDNYPNPFNLSTTIAFHLSQPVKVLLAIYDVQGHVIRMLINEEKQAGHYVANWDGCDAAGKYVASGIYFYQLATNQFSVTKKCLLIK
ncbi:MAG: T9SS type A sorting domain-containing protein, partial [candidate division KSB1 bacterium]|nr:T9SS type A sorting domain-containing protein [candidate division KSB1 bacterium]